ncbi:MAG: hypothetical protein DLM64_14565 [Solirubrobacterales bacterium]|nr:MAG: hypothetical protein DLM64_14565 [Solirubrobacterales bacterium]
MRVFVNAAGASSGGGRTWVLGLAGELQRGGGRGLDWELLVRSDLAELVNSLTPGVAHVHLHRHRLHSAPARIAWEQLVLPLHPAVRRADVLVNAANFAPLGRRRPDALHVGNALYFDELRIAGARGLRYRIEAWLGRASVRAATMSFAPSEAMAARVEAYAGRRPVVIPLGPGLVTDAGATGEDRFVFAHRTFWGPHKRFGELLAAVRELAGLEPGRFVLRTACDPRTEFARAHRESASERVQLEDALIARHLEFASFGPADAGTLAADAVVMPSTVESFCFPLAEAVGAGVPVVAADSDFARELCGPAAVYADPGDPAGFAAAMRAVMLGASPSPSPAHQRRLSWVAHVDGLAELCRQLGGRG